MTDRKICVNTVFHSQRTALKWQKWHWSMAYFNKTYVATERFPRELGRKLGKLQQLREKSDYDDFYLASREVAETQVKSAKMVMEEIIKFIQCVGVGDL